MTSTAPWWLWIAFSLFILSVFTIDFLNGRKAHHVGPREALSWVLIWMTLAFLFNFFFWWYLKQSHPTSVANQKALEFLTGFLIEQSLSIDNMFAFVLIFNYFAIPVEYQRRVLLYGVLSAIVLRLLLICAGTWAIAKIHWILYIFGAFLVLTGIKMLVMEEKKDLSQNPVLIFMMKHIRMVPHLVGEAFFIKKNSLWFATPLFIVLLLIEMSDLVFALDSIPAIFAITNDVFIIFTSNIFAILGLRAMYFLLMDMATRFHLLRYGIALLLTFVGVKMLIKPWVTIPILMALAIIIAILATTIILSIFTRKKRAL